AREWRQERGAGHAIIRTFAAIACGAAEGGPPLRCRCGCGGNHRPPAGPSLPKAAYVLAQLRFDISQLAEVPADDHAGRVADIVDVMIGRTSEHPTQLLCSAHVL